MLNKIFQLVRPRQFEVVYKDITLDDSHVIVRPKHLSICNADQRYYQGLRSEDVLKKKLPMALIHEGTGKVVYDPAGHFSRGERVVMIPNTPVEHDDIVAENYLRTSKFRASGFDGFLQEYVAMDPDRLVSLPEGIDPGVSAFTEFVSVSCHAITRFKSFSHERRDTIGVWGDGNLGYVTALLLRFMLPGSKICVFGVNDYKLNDFSFADEVYLVNDVPEGTAIDHAFECVGGGGAPKAINQIIDLIRPEGTISILGVTEDLAPINTRMVLEKGLRIFGSSRSGRSDFERIIELEKEYPQIAGHLEKIVGAQITVHSIADVTAAFETDIHKIMGKTIMNWEI